MDPLTSGLIALLAIVIGASVYALQQMNERINQLQESSSIHDALIEDDMSTLSGALNNLIDEADASRRLTGSDVLLKSQHLIESLDNGNEFQLSSFNSSLRLLLSSFQETTIETDIARLDSVRREILSNHMRIIQEKDLAIHSLFGRNDVQCRIFSKLCNSLGHRDLALVCLLESEKIAPRHEGTLRRLASIARENGDDIFLRHRLDKLLHLYPDDPELLRERAHLLFRIGDSAAELDSRRLEALGLQNAADRALLAGLRERAGDPSTALEEVDAALETNPNDPNSWHLKARLHSIRNEPGRALNALNELFEIDRQHGPAWTLQSQLLSNEPNRLNEALKAAIHAVALGEPEWIMKADLLMQLDRFDEAISSLESVLEITPENGHVRAHLSLLHMLDDNHEVAGNLLVEASSKTWECSEMHIQKGRLVLREADIARDGTGHHDRGLVRGALTFFDTALTFDREAPLAWVGRARTLRQLGELDEAEVSIVRAFRLDSNDPMILVEHALLKIDQGNLPEAERLVHEAETSLSDTEVLHYIRGLIAAERGNLDEARRRFDDVLVSDPNHVRARLNRATVAVLMNDHAIALEDSELLLKQYPELDLARLRRAEALMGLTKWEWAEIALREIIERKPGHVPALISMGATLCALDRSEEALPPLDEAIRLDSDNPDAWHMRAQFYIEQGALPAALADLESAISVDPSHTESLLHAAAIAHEIGPLDRAETCWRRVLHHDPTNHLARIRLEESLSKKVI
ncbi:MAG: tetratricopeptide repeat protein [Candidatus Thalassarchaeaceae archaeon]|nr:tetratricopeptide repeat protein [Candidatus Thalassarchaeaceae archaeon]